MTNQDEASQATCRGLGHLARAAAGFATWTEVHADRLTKAQRIDWLMKTRLTDEFGDLVGRCRLLKGRIEIGIAAGQIVEDNTSTTALALSQAARELTTAAAKIRASDPGASRLADLLAAEVRSVAERTAAFQGKFPEQVAT